jgi:hypothetical protein
MITIFTADEKKSIELSEIDFTANRIGEKHDYWTCGSNSLEGRKETTVWKSHEEMLKYIDSCHKAKVDYVRP